MEITKIYAAVKDLGVEPIVVIPLGECYGESFGFGRVKYSVVYLESPMKVLYGGGLPKAHFTVDGVDIKLIRYAAFIQHCLSGTQGYAQQLFMKTDHFNEYWENIQDHRDTFMSSRQTIQESINHIDHGLMSQTLLLSRHILRKTEALLQFWETGDIDFLSLKDCLVPPEEIDGMLNLHRGKLRELLHLSEELDVTRFGTLVLGPYRDMFQDKCRQTSDLRDFVTL